MKVNIFCLFFAIMFLVACNNNGESTSTAMDSMPDKKTDSIKYNPATPAAQNSDDPNRYSQ